ncbi:hypothetical protein EK21DRAFT_106380 [Setomelanomma holmii]|uniref:P-loop containing nucleoside triphosphate hydrolase protein n=1 Tax=Setomelanomma holmii TaxID=210430 RepID=A0A9P4HN55_9PLEO|nr:hypothetical protein EK21DRAFT_106380 [Setomelanomma holmii]
MTTTPPQQTSIGPSATTNPPPLLIFVLNTPCAGKSTICSALSTLHDLDHFSVGAEMRSLISPQPTGPALAMKPILSDEPFAEVCYGAAFWRGRETEAGWGAGRMVERWPYFKEAVGDWWRPGVGAILVMLSIEREIARRRFERRARTGEEFDRKHDEHEKSIDAIVAAIRQDGATVVELEVDEWMETGELVRRLQEVPA